MTAARIKVLKLGVSGVSDIRKHFITLYSVPNKLIDHLQCPLLLRFHVTERASLNLLRVVPYQSTSVVLPFIGKTFKIYTIAGLLRHSLESHNIILYGTDYR